jgi:glycoside/pentoside/hexuronide:cation symporter, GPH family
MSDFRPPTHVTLAFCAGAVGSGILSTVPSILLLYYCTEIAGISAAWAAVVLFLPKVLALVIDPAVGRIFDRASGSQPPRLAIMTGGTILMVIAFKLTFSAPHAGAIIWTMVSYALLSLGFSVYMVCHVAMPALYIDNKDARTQWVGWRMMAAFVGILLGAAGAPALVEHGGGGVKGYASMATALSVVCLIVACGAIWSLAHMPLRSKTENKVEPGFIDSLAYIARAPGPRALLLGYLSMLTAIGVVTSSLPYLIVKISGRSEAEVGTALGVLLVAGIASAPVWTWIGTKMSVVRGMILAAIGYALSVIVLGVCVAQHVTWTYQLIAFVFVGIPFAGLQVLPYTLCAHMARAEAQAGGPGEAMMAGIWTATEKLGLASGPAATALLISLNGGVDPRFAIVVSIATAALLLLSTFLFNPLQRLQAAHIPESLKC